MSQRKQTKNTSENGDSDKTIISVQLDKGMLAELQKRAGDEPLSYAIREVLRKGLGRKRLQVHAA